MDMPPATRTNELIACMSNHGNISSWRRFIAPEKKAQSENSVVGLFAIPIKMYVTHQSANKGCKVHRHQRMPLLYTMISNDNSPTFGHRWNESRRWSAHGILVFRNTPHAPFDPLHNRTAPCQPCILVLMPSRAGTAQNAMQSANKLKTIIDMHDAWAPSSAGCDLNLTKQNNEIFTHRLSDCNWQNKHPLIDTQNLLVQSQLRHSLR